AAHRLPIAILIPPIAGKGRLHTPPYKLGSLHLCPPACDLFPWLREPKIVDSVILGFLTDAEACFCSCSRVRKACVRRLAASCEPDDGGTRRHNAARPSRA